MKRETNIHRGHRSAVRRKLLTVGADAFLPHELLELLLFYSVPLSDTNPTAHRLMERFGTLEGVLTAEEDTLCTVPGLGAHSAELLRLVYAVGSRAAEESEEAGSPEDSRSLGEYLLTLFREEHEDVTYLLLLDNAYRLLHTRKVFTGDYSSAAFQDRFLIEPALRFHASQAVLASSHSNRVARASLYELNATKRFRESLGLVGVHLLEHYLISGGYYSQLSRQIPDIFREYTDPAEFFKREGAGEYAE